MISNEIQFSRADPVLKGPIKLSKSTIKLSKPGATKPFKTTVKLSKSVSNKLSKSNKRSNLQAKTQKMPETDTFVLTSFLTQNVLDLADIYTYICFDVFPNELNNKQFIDLLEHMSYLNIRSEVASPELCDALATKSMNAFENFIEKASDNPGIARGTSIFRSDPKPILNEFVKHKNKEQASSFLRYIIHTKYLPDMTAFLEFYKNANDVERDAIIPKIVYSWHDVE